MAIKRRKSDSIKCPNTGVDCVVWDLELDGEVVGRAVATYKTATQRTWDANMTVDGVTVSVEGAFSIARAIAQLEEQLASANTAVEQDETEAEVSIAEATQETA